MQYYQQEFLAGFSIRNAPVFEEWVTLQRSQLHGLAVQGFHLLGQHYLTHHEYETGLTLNRRWLTIDPEAETAHRQRMHLLAASGQRSAALAQYEICRRLLADEFGVAPAAETTLLYEQIRTGHFAERQWQPLPHPKAPPVTPPPSTALPENDLPRTTTFCGRQAEIAQLQQWLVAQRCTLVSIFGMGGQGKTALAAHLVRTLAPMHAFAQVLWCSLLNAPPPADIFEEWLRRLTPDVVTPLPEAVDEQLTSLLTHLKQQRVLLILDNLESVLLPGGAFRPGYEAYGQFIEWLASRSHQSALLLTSRERPAGLLRLEQDLAKVQSLQLAGLPTETGKELWQTFQIGGGEEEVATLVDYYSGNPLAIKLVATTVRDFFAGNLAAFLGDKAILFADIRQVLDQHFARLAPLEQRILFWLAIHREPIVFATLWANLVRPPARHEGLSARQALQRGSLVDVHDTGFGLQNVVMEYVTGRLQQLFVGNLDEVLLVAFDPTGEEILSIGQDGAVWRWSLRPETSLPVAPWFYATATGDAHHTIGMDINWAAGLIASSGGDGVVRCWDLHSGELCCTFRGHTDIVGVLAFRPDGRVLASSSKGQTTRLWLVDRRQTGREQAEAFALITCPAGNLIFSPDGRFLFSNVRSILWLWDTITNQLHQQMSGQSTFVAALAYSTDGRMVATGSFDQTVRIWDVERGRTEYTLMGLSRWLDHVRFSLDGATIACSQFDQTVQLWANSGQHLYTLRGHGGNVGVLVYRWSRLWILAPTVNDHRCPACHPTTSRAVCRPEYHRGHGDQRTPTGGAKDVGRG